MKKVLAILVLLVTMLPSLAHAGGVVYQQEAEKMTRVGTTGQYNDSTASGALMIKAWNNASGVAGSTSFLAGSTTFTFRAREDTYLGDAQVGLYIDGATVPLGNTTVTNTSGWANYSIAATLAAGTHSFSLLFNNDRYGGSTTADRNAYFDTVTVSQSSIVPSSTPTPTATRPTATPTTPPLTATPTAVTSGPSHVFLIVFENHNWSTVKGSSSAPYINNTLLPQSSYASAYYNPPGIHPSLPNYLWLEAGTNFGIKNDNPPSSNTQTTTAHLTTLLNSAGISWKTYAENISGISCPTSDSYPYAVRHNPMVYFSDVSGNPAYCVSHERPFSELNSDLSTNTVPRYTYIAPNLCDDGHDTCSPVNDQVKQTDNFLSSVMPQIFASQAYQDNGVVFITWDEGGSGSDGPIGMIVLGPSVKGGGYTNSTYYNHGSYLRTVQEIFNVSPLLNNAASATDLSDLFRQLP